MTAARENYKLLALFALPVLPYLVMYVFWPTSHLFLPDDAFYYLKIARNIAAGLGSSFDGINPTNGYHPLWLLLLSAAASLPLGPDGFVALALALQGLMCIAGFVILYRILNPRMEPGQPARPAAIACLLLWNYYLSKILINGLESSLLLLSISLLLWLFGRTVAEGRMYSPRRAAWLGGLGAVTVLARLDSVFILPVLAAVMAWPVLREPRLWRPALRSIIIFGAIPTAILLVYMVVNLAMFDTWMPISGMIKRHALDKGDGTGWLNLAVIGGVLAATWLTLRPLSESLAKPAGVALAVLAGFIALYQGDYFLQSHSLMMTVWYLAPHLMWFFLALNMTLARVQRRAPRLARLATTAGTAVLLAGCLLSWMMRLNPQSYRHYVAAHDASEWINQNLGPDDVLAGWDVGITGYYSNRPVVNLDGLVNSRDYYQHMVEGRGVEFLRQCRVNYLVQYYPNGFENYSSLSFGPDLQKLHTRVVWSEAVTARSIYNLLRPGASFRTTYPYEIRKIDWQ